MDELNTRANRIARIAFILSLISLLPLSWTSDLDGPAYSVVLEQPTDGEYIEGDILRISYSSESLPDDAFIALYFSGNEIFRTEKSADTLDVNIAGAANINWYAIEVKILSKQTESVLESDRVSVFLLGDAVVAPENLDDDDSFCGNVTAMDDAVQAVLRLESEVGWREAKTKFVETLSRLCNIPGPWVPWLFTELGLLLLRGEDVEGALHAFRDAVWHTPSALLAHGYIAEILEMQLNAYGRECGACRGDESLLAEQHRHTFYRLAGGRSHAPPLMPFSIGSEPHVPKVGILTVGSGAYARFFKAHVVSADKYMLRGAAEMHYYVFTDSVEAIEADMLDTLAWRQGRVHIVYREHDGWPSASMKRVHTYYTHRADWAGMDYALCVDVDVRWVSYVGREVLVPTLGTLHADNAHLAGYEVTGPHTLAVTNNASPASMWRQSSEGGAFLSGAVYERRGESKAAVGEGEGKHYYAGGLYGGQTPLLVRMMEALVTATDSDTAAGLVARFHDESHINRYWSRNPPSRVLSCAYLYPEPTVEECWG